MVDPKTELNSEPVRSLPFVKRDAREAGCRDSRATNAEPEELPVKLIAIESLGQYESVGSGFVSAIADLSVARVGG